MQQFLTRHQSVVKGVLSGLDRVRFRGTIRWLATLHGMGHQRFEGDVITTLKTREEGTRVKHALNRNSIRMYDKQGSVLRVETTVNDPRDMKVFRTKESAPDGPMSWLRLRKGVADMHRRANQPGVERTLSGQSGRR